MTLPYQFTAQASQGNAFAWRTGEPSVFASDRGCIASGPDGTSKAEQARRVKDKKVSIQPREFHVYSLARQPL